MTRTDCNRRPRAGRRLGAALALAAIVALAPPLSAAPPENLDAALASQRQHVEQHPGDAGALNDLANLLLLAGDREGAEAAYAQALAHEPEQPQARFNLALLLHDQGRLRQAVRELRRLVKHHPDHAWGQYQLGALYAERGNRSRALERYVKAFRLDPRLSDPVFNQHILSNPLATAAMLRAFSELSNAAAVPRLYADPGRVTALLLPVTPPAPADEAEPAADEPQDDG